MQTWVIYYVLFSVFCWWIVFGGGAERLEGWLSFIMIAEWRSEPVKIYALVVWVVATAVFVVGLTKPEVRALVLK